MTTSTASLSSPIHQYVIDVDYRIVNDSLVLADRLAVWYHCRKCIEKGVSLFRVRLAIFSKFCPQCGTALVWPIEKSEERKT